MELGACPRLCALGALRYATLLSRCLACWPLPRSRVPLGSFPPALAAVSPFILCCTQVLVNRVPLGMAAQDVDRPVCAAIGGPGDGKPPLCASINARLLSENCTWWYA